jgi:hypothetical protein
LEVLEEAEEERGDEHLLPILIAGFASEQQLMTVAIYVRGALEVRLMLIEKCLRDRISAARKKSIFVPVMLHTTPPYIAV